MEDLKKKMSAEMNDKEIVYSRAVKAGKRIYYLDVKKNRKDEMFLAITESKKVISGEGDDTQVSFEKHKIFLYKEDFTKFMTGLEQAIGFITKNEENLALDDELNHESNILIEETDIIEELKTEGIGGKINIDIDFE
ncbi:MULTISPECIES: DUF3276 family protein [Bacteroides]|uniref:DUF3276 family protein n=1 Tax=Bacteroides TaxID=816 RepID=UPI0004ADB7F4|nr:DUF3276 family protein [Bacteroides neonati]